MGEGDTRPDGGVDMKLRTRLAVGAAVLVVVAIGLQVLAIKLATGAIDGEGVVAPSYVVPTILTTLSSFSVACGAALVLGYVALLVVDEALVRRLEVEAIAEGDDDESADGVERGEGDALPAYGTDPERL